MKKVGILVGKERSFPQGLIHRVAERDAGVMVEWVKLGGTALDDVCEYSVIVDRISHEVPYYADYLKHAYSQGVHVINNPFRRAAEDKFNANYMAQQLGVAVPKTVVLPNKEYILDIVAESLSNLKFPVDWQGIADYVGMPAVLKPASGGGWKSVSIVHNVDELITAYNRSGQLTMIVQEFIEWQHYLRCLCVGQEKVMPIAWNPNVPHHQRYSQNPGLLSPELGQLVIDQALALSRGLGYDMNTVEFAISDGVPVAIDFTNAAPDFDVASLGEWHFNWVLDAMADYVIQQAHAAPFPRGKGYGEG
ncbi:MAG: ATP-grasp domain-containing protein [Caldilineaceae bacterium]|nr:ATP-grasp domain-containing protein [Caldilineaceae bacterium]MBP8106036.1 ATP-grasp domain-containing protein [Caldilineaceae bacterium]MBP8121958.1 ATP-grasp domain-containing protein [Caldilineaceae bacterium]MBP9074625.1 ATP-grasp domain-containing protein [Caldilineaceae bacterium]